MREKVPLGHGVSSMLLVEDAVETAHIAVETLEEFASICTIEPNAGATNESANGSYSIILHIYMEYEVDTNIDCGILCENSLNESLSL